MSTADLSLVETADGLQVVFGGKPLYDSTPASTAVRKARAVPALPQTLYLVPSPAAWHGVAELRSRLSADSAILAIESNPILLELARRLMPPDLATAGVTLSLAEPAAVRSALGTSGPGRFRRVREVTLSAGALLDRNRYRSLRELIEQDIRISWQNRLTRSAMGRLWVRNLFLNTPRLAVGAPLPHRAGPVVVCGAGPSLERAVDLLRAVRGRLIIVAADTALPALSRCGICPDYVVAVEAQIANVYDFLPVSERTYTLIADLSSSPAVIDLHDPRRVSWFVSEFAPVSVLERIAAAGFPLSVIPPLGSVGVAAASIAFSITDGAVLFTGLDFAFRVRADDRLLTNTHARGTEATLRAILSDSRLRRRAAHHLGIRLLRRTGTDGDAVATTLPLIGYAEQLHALVRAEKARAGRDTKGAGHSRTIAAIEPFGLHTGAVAIDLAAAQHLITTTAAERPGASGTDHEGAPARGHGDGGALHRTEVFLTNELSALDRLISHLEARLRGDSRLPDAASGDDPLTTAFLPCNYVAVDFPEYPGDGPPARTLLPKIRIAADYYRGQLQTAIRALRS